MILAPLAIVPVWLNAAALIVGLVALDRIRHGAARGRGLAIAGVVIGGVVVSAALLAALGIMTLLAYLVASGRL
jgi:hypothetical protein